VIFQIVYKEKHGVRLLYMGYYFTLNDKYSKD
jgi:hypothetical protein